MAAREQSRVREQNPIPAKARVAPGERVYAIGDIHGEVHLLAKLLELISEDNVRRPLARTTLIFLGDLIDGGSGSAALLNCFAGFRRPGLIVLKGNHESLLVESYRGNSTALRTWMRRGGRATMGGFGITGAHLMRQTDEAVIAILQASIDSEKIEWIDRLPISWFCGDYFFVHAGVRPAIPLDWQSPDDLIWIREPFLSSTAYHGRVVVHGHTISIGNPHLYSNRIGIDTGSHENGRLTALRLEEDTQYLLQTARGHTLSSNTDADEDIFLTRRFVSPNHSLVRDTDDYIHNIKCFIDRILGDPAEEAKIQIRPRSPTKHASDYNLHAKTPRNHTTRRDLNRLIAIGCGATALSAAIAFATHEPNQTISHYLARDSDNHNSLAEGYTTSSDLHRKPSQIDLSSFDMDIVEKLAPSPGNGKEADVTTRKSRDLEPGALETKDFDDDLEGVRFDRQIADRRKGGATQRPISNHSGYRLGTAVERGESRISGGVPPPFANPADLATIDRRSAPQSAGTIQSEGSVDQITESAASNVSGPAIHLTGLALAQALAADHIATEKLNDTEIHRLSKR